MSDTRLPDIIARHEQDLLTQWGQMLVATGAAREDLIKPEDLKSQCAALLAEIRKALQSSQNVSSPAWQHTKENLAEISRSRARQGFTPLETANFVFTLKEPIFKRLRTEHAANPVRLAEDSWAMSVLVDSLGMVTMEAYLHAREEVIKRQQEAMLELSTPVVKLWDGVLALPLIGTLDSARTQVVMETLLQRVVVEATDVVIIDITGVPTVDTLVAQHLLKTVTAARLMGTDCIISGIRPQIAQTIVHLGVDLASVITKSTLADAFKIALDRRQLMVVKKKAGAGAGPVTAATRAG